MTAFVKVDWLDGVQGETPDVIYTDPEQVAGVTQYGVQATTDVNRSAVTLQGSIDGVNWVDLLGATYGTIVWTDGKPVNYVRLKVSFTDELTDTVSASAIATDA